MEKKVLLLWLLMILTSCVSAISETTLPRTPIDISQSPYSGKEVDTAFAALEIAIPEAKKWNENAVLHLIVPTRMMEQNLGLPGGGPGWFFMFKQPGKILEYYIEVVEGEIYGSTEAQPIQIEEPKYKLQPLIVYQDLLDSDMALKVFLENDGDVYLSTHPNAILNYRLVKHEDIAHPVWTIYDVSDNHYTILINIDALSGEIVNDPMP